MTSTIGVGIVGCGPVTQAIHLPTLNTVRDRFHVARVMDINGAVAENVAGRCGAKFSAKIDEILNDPQIHVVAICSPNHFHAEQVIACCRAGKKLILCEKPLAVSREEAAEIRRVATETSTALVVGTMHAYDPAYREAQRRWQDEDEFAHHVRSSIYLPSNDVFIDQATDQTRPPAAQRQNSEPNGKTAQSTMMRAAVLGLAIHNIPLVREFYPEVSSLKSARFLEPFGYALTMSNDKQAAQFNALMPGDWPPYWQLNVVGNKKLLKVAFPPSYVLAGSSRAEIRSNAETVTFEYPKSGYEIMWEHIFEIIKEKNQPLFTLDSLVADLGFALDLADGAVTLIQEANS